MTSWRRIGPADASTLVTLDELRAHLRVDHQEEDQLLLVYLGAAVEHAEDFCRRPLLSGQYEATCTLPGPRGSIELPTAPRAHLDVESIEYRDQDGKLVPVPAEEWELYPGDHPEVRPAQGVYWPPAVWGREVVVRYALDYIDGEPNSVQIAALLLAAHWYANREAVVTGTIATQVLQGANMLLWPHRRLSFG